MCSDGRGYHGNGVVLWPWMYHTNTRTHTHSLFLSPSISLHLFMHTYSELQVPPKVSSFLILIDTLSGRRITISDGANFPQCPAATGHPLRPQQAHQYSWAIWWICKWKKTAVARWTTAAHQSEAALRTRHPGVGDVAGNGISGHQRQLIMSMILINAYNHDHKHWDLN